MFSNDEEHLLAPSSAFRWKERGMTTEISWQSLLKCLASYSCEGAFYFSQKNTDEQNTQRPTETLSQPISQNLTATFSSNALWTLYAGGVLWDRNCAPKSSVNSVRSVRDKTPQRVTCVSSFREGAFFLSQKITDEQNTQRFTETSSQPISQNVTANLSWKASVNSVCRRPSVSSKRWWKSSVKSVSSVREKLPSKFRKCSFSHR